MFSIVAVLLVPAAGVYVASVARGHLYDDVTTVPKFHAALVLGCSKKVSGGRSNVFFESRINATVKLFQAGKVSVIVVSGDNSVKEYNEPTDMREALVAAGVPENRIHCDYAGFRTLDSVVRMREIFGQTRFIIVSQRFHNERALYIARRKGLDAAGFDARAVSFRWAPSTYARELLARCKAVLDVEVLGTAPKFLGPHVEIGP